MNTNMVLGDEERIFTLSALGDGISELLAAVSNLQEARDSSDMRQVLPSGAERLQHIQQESGELLEELIVLQREYMAQMSAGDFGC